MANRSPSKSELEDSDTDQVATGFRIPAATRPGPVSLATGELDETMEFYQKVLGMRSEETDSGVALFASEETDEPLLVFEQQDGLAPVPRQGHFGLFHLAILLPDRASLGRFVRHLIDTGVRFGASDHLVSEAIYFSDNNGFGIEVYADRPSKQWQRVDQQIVMDTIALDLDDVMAEAADTAWNGLPKGTRVGHIHLRVGDLTQAERFYHRMLGLDKTVWTYPGALFMSAGGYHHHVAVNTWARNAGLARNDEARLLEFTLVLPDLDSLTVARNTLMTAGITVNEHESSIIVSDPWGTHVRLLVEPAA